MTPPPRIWCCSSKNLGAFFFWGYHVCTNKYTVHHRRFFYCCPRCFSLLWNSSLSPATDDPVIFGFVVFRFTMSRNTENGLRPEDIKPSRSNAHCHNLSGHRSRSCTALVDAGLLLLDGDGFIILRVLLRFCSFLICHQPAVTNDPTKDTNNVHE